MADKAPWEIAALEAYEEAGVTGEIEQTPIGSYFLPVTSERPLRVEVQVYPMLVTEQREDWKEKGQRYRHWAVLPEAKRLITHDGLAELAVKLSQRELGTVTPMARTAASLRNRVQQTVQPKRAR